MHDVPPVPSNYDIPGSGPFNSPLQHCKRAILPTFTADRELSVSRNMKSARIPCVHSCCQRGALANRRRLPPSRCQAERKSSFFDTSLSSRVSKGLVSGLTAFVNGVAGNQAAATTESQTLEINLQQPVDVTRSPEDILDGACSSSSVHQSPFTICSSCPCQPDWCSLCCRGSQGFHREQLSMDRQNHSRPV